MQAYRLDVEYHLPNAKFKLMHQIDDKHCDKIDFECDRCEHFKIEFGKWVLRYTIRSKQMLSIQGACVPSLELVTLQQEDPQPPWTAHLYPGCTQHVGLFLLYGDSVRRQLFLVFLQQASSRFIPTSGTRVLTVLHRGHRHFPRFRIEAKRTLFR